MSLDKLSQYGKSFQTKIISALLKDKKFLTQIYDILLPEFFEADSNAELIKIIKDYYKKYNDIPTLQVFKVKTDEVENDLLKTTMVEQLRDVATNMDSPDLQYVKDEFLEFCKFQKLKSAILDSVDLMKSADYELIKTKIDNALRAGTEMDFGHIYKTEEAIEARLVKETRDNVIATEWEVINEILDGGLGGGDLGIFIGAAGASKTWALVSLGYHALMLGKNVLHFTLELNDRYTGKRYDSKLINIPSNKLKYHIEDIKDGIENKVKGELIIKYYPTKSASVTTLRNHVDKLKSFGHEIDMIIVDYGDLLKSDDINAQKGGSYFESGGIYESLRGMAGELQIPIWTASQAQRSANNVDVITGEYVAESYKKIMTADFVVSVSRKVEDKLASTARYHIIKNRYGVDGLTFPAKINTATGKIDMHEPNSIEGTKTNKEMSKSNELVKKKLAQKFKEFEMDDE